MSTDPPNPTYSKDLTGLELDSIRSGDCGSLEQVSTFKIEPEKDEIPVNGSSFYRLEMIRIQLFSSHGNPCMFNGFLGVFDIVWLLVNFFID